MDKTISAKIIRAKAIP